MCGSWAAPTSADSCTPGTPAYLASSVTSATAKLRASIGADVSSVFRQSNENRRAMDAVRLVMIDCGRSCRRAQRSGNDAKGGMFSVVVLDAVGCEAAVKAAVSACLSDEHSTYAVDGVAECQLIRPDCMPAGVDPAPAVELDDGKALRDAGDGDGSGHCHQRARRALLRQPCYLVIAYSVDPAGLSWVELPLNRRKTTGQK